MKDQPQPNPWAVVIPLVLLNVVSSPKGLLAQTELQNSSLPARAVTQTGLKVAASFRMPSPPSSGIPTGRYRGGASRGDCPQVTSPLTALVPFTEKPPSGEQKSPPTYVWGQTVSSHPTFWFYVPYENWSTYPVEFVLQDEDDNDVYRSAIALPSKPGVVSVRLPSNVAGLELNKPYHWYFNIYCDQRRTPPPDSVDGVVQRVNLNGAIAQQIESASLLQKVDLYAENGIWYDAITTLADLRLAKPEDSTLLADWSSLLQSVNLKDIASAPLIDCCKPVGK